VRVEIHRFAMASPADVSGLEALLAAGVVDPSSVVAVIGKTEGNGGANDFTRALATMSFAGVLARQLEEEPDDVTGRVAFVWSGGCEGVLSPHATVFCRIDDATHTGGEPPSHAKRLAISVQRTRALRPEEVGRMDEVTLVAAATEAALAELGVEDPSDVHLVQVKGPLLTPAAIEEASGRGASVVTTDPNESKRYARAASALGVALGLGEVARAALDDAMIANDLTMYSSVASTSAGGELTACEVIVLANAPGWTSRYRIGHGMLRDAVDVEGVHDALRSAGISFACRPSPDDTARVAAVLAKAEAPVGGRLRGWRTTMLSDADISSERHARAAVGAVIASVTGDPRIFVSGGTEHQGPPGAAPIAAIVVS
jgi:cyanuric acid amidohydrolase